MSHDHDHEPEEIPGLPHALPAGETILWRGRPAWKTLARHAFYVRNLAIYFSIFIVSRGVATAMDGKGATKAVLASLIMVPVAAGCLALIGFLAWLTARSTIYTITSKRVVMRFGLALPMTFNLPFKRVIAADMKAYPSGEGEIALALGGPDRLAYLHLWPHARPWRFTRAMPMLRAVPDVAQVAALLTAAAASRGGGAAHDDRLDAAGQSAALHAEPLAATGTTA